MNRVNKIKREKLDNPGMHNQQRYNLMNPRILEQVTQCSNKQEFYQDNGPQESLVDRAKNPFSHKPSERQILENDQSEPPLDEVTHAPSSKVKFVQVLKKPSPVRKKEAIINVQVKAKPIVNHRNSQIATGLDNSYSVNTRQSALITSSLETTQPSPGQERSTSMITVKRNPFFALNLPNQDTNQFAQVNWTFIRKGCNASIHRMNRQVRAQKRTIKHHPDKCDNTIVNSNIDQSLDNYFSSVDMAKSNKKLKKFIKICKSKEEGVQIPKISQIF